VAKLNVKLKLKITLGALIAIAVLVFLMLVRMSETERFVFSRDVYVETFKQLGSNPYDGYHADIIDSGTKVASIYVRVDPPTSNLGYVNFMFSITPYERTEIDSLSLEFFMDNNYVTMYLETPQGGWPDIEFHRSSNAKGVVFSVEDLGWFGQSTMERDFMLVQFSSRNYTETRITFNMELSMHKMTLLQLTALKAQAFVDITIPR